MPYGAVTPRSMSIVDVIVRALSSAIIFYDSGSQTFSNQASAEKRNNNIAYAARTNLIK